VTVSRPIPLTPSSDAHVALRGTVRDAVRALIVEGELRPGNRLVERTLADRLGVSRVPVREALRDLVAEGFAVTRATGGIAVRDYPPEEVEELFEVRGALESILLRRATGRLSPDDERQLRACLDTTGAALAAGDRAGAVAGNGRFHEVLADVAAGPLLRGLLDGVRDRMRWLLRQHVDPALVHAEHVDLLDALLAGDERTVERLAAHHLATSRAQAALRADVPGPDGPDPHGPDPDGVNPDGASR
jgi:DNA-binding GntR family transcriptional regulator